MRNRLRRTRRLRPRQRAGPGRADHGWRQKVHDILEVGGAAHPASYFVNAFIVTLILFNAVIFAAETVDGLAERYGATFEAFNNFTVAVFTVEYVLRIWSAVDIPLLSRLPPWKARLRFAARPLMIIDLMAILPWYLGDLIPINLVFLRVLRLFRLLKLVRYSPALQTLGRVIQQQWRALVGALLVMLVMLLFASSVIYFVEREIQPETFGSIPAAAWWAIATLTTVGFGDVVPATPLGKLVGGIVMVVGVGRFALPIAILATGFSQESAKREFLATWSMVARIPLFAGMEATELADVTKLLQTRSYAPGIPIVRAGDPGGAMYLIASGEAVAHLPHGKTALLKEGDFFGEMALLDNRRHKHAVTAKSHCRIYILDRDALGRLSSKHPEIMQRIRKVDASKNPEAHGRGHFRWRTFGNRNGNKSESNGPNRPASSAA